MTASEALGASTPLLCVAAELVVSTGALEEAAPLAEFVEEGLLDGLADSDGVGESDGLAEGDCDGDGECECDGDELGGFVVDLVGDGVCDPLVPLGLSEGVPLPVGVGSSDVPIVPSGPGSVGRLVAVPVSLPSPFAGSAPRLSSPVPWLADGLTPTLSDGLSALFLDVAPRVTTVPRTAASSTPAPAATRLRRA
jgi:hypothetical protein